LRTAPHPHRTTDLGEGRSPQLRPSGLEHRRALSAVLYLRESYAHSG